MATETTSNDGLVLHLCSMIGEAISFRLGDCGQASKLTRIAKLCSLPAAGSHAPLSSGVGPEGDSGSSEASPEMWIPGRRLVDLDLHRLLWAACR
jgi:hypothetical protein